MIAKEGEILEKRGPRAKGDMKNWCNSINLKLGISGTHKELQECIFETP
jgi:hypothetical protein